jgi:hypothetical protein
MADARPIAIAFEGVTKRFGQAVAVADISLAIPESAR